MKVRDGSPLNPEYVHYAYSEEEILEGIRDGSIPPILGCSLETNLDVATPADPMTIASSGI